jgi:hypothetical protein
MGWQHEEHGTAHEGYLIGLVEEERGSGLFRELTRRHDGNIDGAIPLRYVCVGCDCGWRSPRMFAPSGTEWTPCSVWLAHGRGDDSIADGYEESARKIWAAHVADVREHGTPVLRCDEDGMRRAWDRAVARRRSQDPR